MGKKKSQPEQVSVSITETLLDEGISARSKGDNELARQYFLQVLRVATESEVFLQAEAHERLGDMAAEYNKTREVTEYYNKAISLYRIVDERESLIDLYLKYSLFFARTKRQSLAHKWSRKAYNLALEQDGSLDIGSTGLILGSYLSQDDPQQAQAVFDTALAVIRPSNDYELLLDLLIQNGALAHKEQQYDLAERLLLEALETSQAQEYVHMQGLVLYELAEVALDQADYGTARRWSQQALTTIDDPTYQGMMYTQAAFIELCAGEYTQAIEYTQHFSPPTSAVKDTVIAAEALMIQTCALMHLQPEIPQAQIDEMRALLQARENQSQLLSCLLTLAVHGHLSGHIAEAQALHTEAQALAEQLQLEQIYEVLLKKLHTHSGVLFNDIDAAQGER